MRLPQELSDAIQAEVEKIEWRRLVQAAARLSESYKTGDFSSPAITNEAQRAAYLAVRLPAIYAACLRVFSEIQQLAPQAEITSILDLGAGPGTALFAASEIFPALQQAQLIESDDRWLALGRNLAQASRLEAVRRAEWHKQDLRSGFTCEPHDLVVISYALGELAPAAAEAVIRKAWTCTRQFLVVMEPGTPRGFMVMNAARSVLIASGAAILAPCPHKAACPMAAAGDWCHFSQRIERSSQHRQLKGGTLGYEDEKFSYVVASRQDVAAGGGRVVRHPGKRSGHIQLVLCTSEGQIENKTITRSSGQTYKL
ncbi:MAG TPA: small ribosomal subunit Rsm22 family protein, partial [Candidatus Sulfotelmatobacter sp.]|nr:small ribosomal subunit Rsm22 family protein [Candidatus Sulfotelmatobacter sp.]